MELKVNIQTSNKVNAFLPDLIEICIEIIYN